MTHALSFWMGKDYGPAYHFASILDGYEPVGGVVETAAEGAEARVIAALFLACEAASDLEASHHG